MNRTLRRSVFAVAAGLALPASAATLAITHATIHTLGSAGTVTDATLVVRDALIDAVGQDVTIPGDAKVIDAHGAVITPGLFDADTRLGLEEISAVEETQDAVTNNPRYGAAIDVTDGLNPRSTLIPVARIAGITQAMSAPFASEGGPLFAGRGAIVNLGTLDHFVAKPRAAMFVTLGESGMAQVKGGRPALLLELREALEEAKHLGSTSPVQRPAQLSALDAEALKPVIGGELPLVVDVQRAADITALFKLADEYELKLVIHGGLEAHLVAKELAARNIPVILDPLRNLPSSFSQIATRPDSAAILQKAGVRIAFSAGDDMGSHNSRKIRQLAGNAVAHGLPWPAALAAVTLNPAALYGLDGTLGTLEVGKSATFVVWDGDPLDVTSSATQVYAEGRAVPMVSRQTLLRDRYARGRHLTPAPVPAP